LQRGQEEAQADLAEHVAPIHRAISGALNEFLEKHSPLRHSYSLRSEASIIHDLMVIHLRKEFEDVPGVGLHLKQHLFLLGINGKYVIRTKKLSKRLLTRNHVTQQVLDFLHQAQLEIPGIETPTNLNIGYQPNGAELGTAKIWMTCPNGGKVAWAWPLSDASEDYGPSQAQVPLTVITPVTPATPVTAAPAARVKPRATVPDSAKKNDQEEAPGVADGSTE
jgi:hypothetical protein